MAISDSMEGNSGRCRAQSLHQQEVWIPHKPLQNKLLEDLLFQSLYFILHQNLFSQLKKGKKQIHAQSSYFTCHVFIFVIAYDPYNLVSWATSDNTLLRTLSRAAWHFYRQFMIFVPILEVSPRSAPIHPHGHHTPPLAARLPPAARPRLPALRAGDGSAVPYGPVGKARLVRTRSPHARRSCTRKGRSRYSSSACQVCISKAMPGCGKE